MSKSIGDALRSKNRSSRDLTTKSKLITNSNLLNSIDAFKRKLGNARNSEITILNKKKLTKKIISSLNHYLEFGNKKIHLEWVAKNDPVLLLTKILKITISKSSPKYRLDRTVEIKLFDIIRDSKVFKRIISKRQLTSEEIIKLYSDGVAKTNGAGISNNRMEKFRSAQKLSTVKNNSTYIKGKHLSILVAILNKRK